MKNQIVCWLKVKLFVSSKQAERNINIKKFALGVRFMVYTLQKELRRASHKAFGLALIVNAYIS